MIADSGGNPKAAGPVNRRQGAGAADSPYAGGSAHPPARPVRACRPGQSGRPPPPSTYWRPVDIPLLLPKYLHFIKDNISLYILNGTVPDLVLYDGYY